MIVPSIAILQYQRQRGRGLCDKLDRPIPHGIANKTGPCQRGDVAGTPGHAAEVLVGDDRPGGRFLRLDRLEAPFAEGGQTWSFAPHLAGPGWKDLPTL